MATPLLETKLHVPRSRSQAVPRGRLLEQLDRGAGAALTLVSAPAGFGKSTLLTQWLQTHTQASQGGSAVAWVSLDTEDSDPLTFCRYMVASLRTVLPEVGAEELALLDAADPPPVRRLLTTVLNDIAAGAIEVVLVLDDYHVIESREVHDLVTFLLEHLPPQLRLVIAGRSDPAVPLARLRARGELVEVRAAELRFTSEETTSYLNGAMGLTLAPAEVAALEDRTEGWIAALQLAALSMRGREDVEDFVAGFTGDDRYVVDYLVEEVLQRQPATVRTFLLQTSVLDRLTGELCEALTGEPDGRAMLESLDRANLFLVPLDDHRRWYRYHHLFADMLRARLLDEQPTHVQVLHRRASGWFEQHGDRAAAIRHALAAADFELAAELVERESPASRRARGESTLLGWLRALPDEVLEDRPVLSVVYAGTLLSTGTLDGVERRLQDAERWLAAPQGRPGDAPARPKVVDEEELRRLPAWVAIYRAAQALLRGDPSSTASHADQALGLLAPGDDIGRAAASALSGLASWTEGDLESAHEAYTTCSEIFVRAGYFSDVLGCAITLGDIRVTQGRLRDAMATYEQALRVTGQAGEVNRRTALRGVADMYVAMSRLHVEHDDLDAARTCLEVSRQLGEHRGLPQNRYRRRVAMARLREAEGDLAGALTLLEEAERSYVGDFSPEVRPVSASVARLQLAQHRLAEAAAWVRRRGLSASDDVGYLREFEHLTLARVLIHQYRAQPSPGTIEQAAQLLGRLAAAAEAGGRTGSLIEVLTLQALTHQERGDIPAALGPLERALQLAEPEGYIRTFLDEGAEMQALLTAEVSRGRAPGYARILLHRMPEAVASQADAAAATRRTPAGMPVEPLSARERDVLRLLATDLAGPEIARELVVSLNTVRTHTRNIYSKLGVSNRRAAVRRAEELQLVRAHRFS
jgi:LuxR family transcriptional regulator, maltose regulon positive regulatory protein